MSVDIRERMNSEIDSRLSRLKNNYSNKVYMEGNQYEELNHALARVIAVPLMNELESLKEYMNSL